MALSLSHDNMALIEPVGRSSPGPLDRRPDLTRLRALIRNAPYLRKWVILGALIGLISGLGAVLFFWALDQATRFFLGTLAGFTPASPAGEGGAPIVDIGRRWALPLIVAAGGLISGIIVFRFAPEAEGHGTDAAIAAIHHDPRGIRVADPGWSSWSLRRSRSDRADRVDGKARRLRSGPASGHTWHASSTWMREMPGSR